MAFVGGSVSLGASIGTGRGLRVSDRARSSRYGRRLQSTRMAMTPEKSAALLELKNFLEKDLPNSLKPETPVEIGMYTDDVLFKDPLNNFRGAEKQKKNIQMLKKSPIMQADEFHLHSIWIDEKEEAVMTRWTLNLQFQLLPWKPIARFTGTSLYGMNDDLKVDRHIDEWDSIRNQEPLSTEGISYLLSEFFRKEAFDTENDTVPSTLIRKDVKGYEIRRVPSCMIASTNYENRGEGMDTLDRYFNGLNEEVRLVGRMRPLLLRFPEGLEKTDSKSMFNYMVSPKAPSSSTGEVATSRMKQMTVAVISFTEPITPNVAAGYDKYLEKLITEDGYQRASKEVFFGQYTAVFTLPWARRNEIWIPLLNED